MAPDPILPTGSGRARRRLVISSVLSALVLAAGPGSALTDDRLDGPSAASAPAAVGEQPSGSGPDPEPSAPTPPSPTEPAPESAAPAPAPPPPAPTPPAPAPAPGLGTPVELPVGGGVEVPRAALKIGIVSPVRAVAGSEQTYTIVVINRGEAPAENVTVSQRLVAQLGIVDPAVAALRIGDRDIAWVIGTISPGERWRVRYRVTMPTDPAIVAGTKANVSWDGGTSATRAVRTILSAPGSAVAPADGATGTRARAAV